MALNVVLLGQRMQGLCGASSPPHVQSAGGAIIRYPLHQESIQSWQQGSANHKGVQQAGKKSILIYLTC